MRLTLTLMLLLSLSIAHAETCQQARTQIEMNDCAGAALKHEDDKINATYQAVLRKADAAQQKQLKAVQLAWIKFKDLACQFDASAVEGGSLYSTILANCLAEKTRQRQQELEAMLHCQEGDLACPIAP